MQYCYHRDLIEIFKGALIAKGKNLKLWDKLQSHAALSCWVTEVKSQQTNLVSQAYMWISDSLSISYDRHDQNFENSFCLLGIKSIDGTEHKHCNALWKGTSRSLAYRKYNDLFCFEGFLLFIREYYEQVHSLSAYRTKNWTRTWESRKWIPFSRYSKRHGKSSIQYEHTYATSQYVEDEEFKWFVYLIFIQIEK